jgi:uncharacterized protein
MVRRLLVVVPFLVSFLAVYAQQAVDRREPVPVLSVNGNGEVQVAPDTALVRLGVTRQAQTGQAAQQGVNTVLRAILEGITALGVAERHIQTSQLTLFPIYAQERPEPMREPRQPRIVGYQATSTVTVRVEDLDQVGPVIDAALTAGANQFEGVHFTLRDDTQVREQALSEAVREARSKAEVIARALNVRLDSVIEVAEGGVSFIPPPYPGREMMAMRAAADTATPVSPGEVTVTANVTIRYRIQPN